MKKLDRELDVGSTELAELRPILDAAIDDHFAEGFLRHEWEGDVLRLSGPGARGSLVRQAGRLKHAARSSRPRTSRRR